MSLGIVTLSAEGLVIARALSTYLPNAEIYAHRSVFAGDKITAFDRILDLTEILFQKHDAIVYVAPCGVAVRAIAPHIDHKTRDPAVVVVDVGGRYAVSLLSGHEGGANRLTTAVANALGAEPVISTTTEAVKDIVVGIGCRRNTAKEALIEAINDALASNALELSRVRLLATADIKQNESGLRAAAETLHIPLLFVPSAQIRAFGDAFESSDFVKERVGLPAVAEPCCMLVAKRPTLIMGKKKCNGITIAMARENCLWSA